MMRALRKRLGGDSRGTAMLEFALVAPALLVFMIASFDLAWRAYATATLQGAMQKAARDSGLETGRATTTQIDNKVKAIVYPVLNNATFVFDRKNHATFERAGQPEKFTDTNANGTRDDGECFEDGNANTQWDRVGGQSGQGGARDITVYKVTMTYPRIMPMYGLLGWGANQEVSATTVLRNQPYAAQATRPVTVICT
jgi:hypothetical protein